MKIYLEINELNNLWTLKARILLYAHTLINLQSRTRILLFMLCIQTEKEKEKRKMIKEINTIHYSILGLIFY